MLLRQLFHRDSSTYTYLVASGPGRPAAIIDPVLEEVEHYLRLIRELDLRLLRALDTHVHADHLSGLAALREATGCVTVMSEHARVDGVGIRARDGDRLPVGELEIEVLYTPGHTDDSCCYRVGGCVFTGDTLLIRGTGRTDFQNGDARAQYRSITERLFRLPDETLVYPGHDYKGETVSSIGEERAHNPRLQVPGPDAYAELMAGLELAYPRMMDVAVPANRALGVDQAAALGRGLGLEPADAAARLASGALVAVDLREPWERDGTESLPGALELPWDALDEALEPGGPLRARLERSGGAALLLCCPTGERSLVALRRLEARGLLAPGRVWHLSGGLEAWREAGLPPQGTGEERRA